MSKKRGETAAIIRQWTNPQRSLAWHQSQKTNRACFFQTMLEPIAALSPMYLAIALQRLFGKPSIFKSDASICGLYQGYIND